MRNAATLEAILPASSRAARFTRPILGADARTPARPGRGDGAG